MPATYPGSIQRKESKQNPAFFDFSHTTPTAVKDQAAKYVIAYGKSTGVTALTKTILEDLLTQLVASPDLLTKAVCETVVFIQAMAKAQRGPRRCQIIVNFFQRCQRLWDQVSSEQAYEMVGRRIEEQKQAAERAMIAPSNRLPKQAREQAILKILSVQFVKLEKSDFFPEDIINAINPYMAQRVKSPWTCQIREVKHVEGCWYDFVLEHSVPIVKTSEILLEIPWVHEVLIKPTTEIARYFPALDALAKRSGV